MIHGLVVVGFRYTYEGFPINSDFQAIPSLAYGDFSFHQYSFSIGYCSCEANPTGIVGVSAQRA